MNEQDFMQVFVVDDHSVVRAGVEMLVRELGGAVTLQAATLKEAEQGLAEQAWSLMILDLNLPDGDGLDFLQSIRKMGYLQPVLIHSLLPEASMTARALKAGATGFICKTASAEEFKAACQLVSTGRRYISPHYAAELANSMAIGEPTARHDRLSEREYQVMSLLATGKSPSQIAQVIGCQVNTISSFRARILKKLELKASADIMRYALQHKLVALG